MFFNLFGKNHSSSIKPDIVMGKINRKDKFLLIDVRSPEEYARGHIEKSISIPLLFLANRIPKIAPNKDIEIVVYCQSGARAKQALLLLERHGYSNVNSLGGIVAWPYKVIK